MILQVVLEGLGLGVLLVLVCAIGIRKGAVGMVHLYSSEVQERCVDLGLVTYEKIRRNALLFKAFCVPGYIAYVMVCVYALNGAKGFYQGFWQLLVILSVEQLSKLLHASWPCPARLEIRLQQLHNTQSIASVASDGFHHGNPRPIHTKHSFESSSVMNLIDRFLIDDYWVGHTKAWTIPGTEDLKPYITAKDKRRKWLFGMVGMAVISAVLATIMMLFMEN